MQTPDGGLSTLTYDGTSGLLSTIQTGSRTVTLTQDGSGDLIDHREPRRRPAYL